jgi:hypothetical protein
MNPTNLFLRPAAKKLPVVFPVALGLFLFGGIGPNMVLAALSVFVLVFGISLLWRPGDPPILLFVFGYQWIQASISIFQANLVGLDVISNSEFAFGDMDTAIALTLVGLAIMALGMRWGAGPERVDLQHAARRVALSQPVSRWFWLYVSAVAVSSLALAFAYTAPGLSQPLLALASVRWAFFFMLGYATFVTASGNFLFTIVFILELAMGFGTYFSDFKTVFLVTLFASIAAGIKFSFRKIFLLGSLGAAVIAFGIAWTAVKTDYRSFLSGGERAQTITVDYWTAVAKLGELVAALDTQALTDAAEKLARRITYVQFFAVVLDYVPRTLPHENGSLMLDSISRPFMPRILFPEKSIIDDTERTNLYTGGLVGDSEGTSISLGWIAELYIDFGEFLMMGPIFFIGYFYGRIYRWCLVGSGAKGLLGFACATAVLMGVYALESSFTKSFGGIVVSLLIVWLIVKIVVPRWCPWVVPAVPR